MLTVLEWIDHFCFGLMLMAGNWVLRKATLYWQWSVNKHFHLTCKSLSLSLEGQQLLLPFHYCYLFLLFSFQGAAATPASLWQSQLHSFTRDNGLRLCGSGVRAFGGCHCHCNHYLCFLSSLFLCLWPASLCRFPQQQTAKVPIILPAPDSTLQCQSLR